MYHRVPVFRRYRMCLFESEKNPVPMRENNGKIIIFSTLDTLKRLIQYCINSKHKCKHY